LKMPRGAVAISSILFTIALLMPAPAMLRNAWTVGRTSFYVTSQATVQNYFAPVGFSSLAIIVIGLIVTWAGYFNRVRWTWFVMFVIVWVWAFPVLLLPYLQELKNAVPITEWPAYAGRGEGGPRYFLEAVLILLLMVIALVIPIKALFLGHGADPSKGASADLRG